MATKADPTITPLKLAVGLDLRERCYGALNFVQALSAQSPAKPEIHGVHILSGLRSELLGLVLGADNMRSKVKTRLEEICNKHAPGLMSNIEIIEDEDRPEGVEFFASGIDADALIVGRVAPRDPTPFVRLGTVTRSILRSLMSPTIVVPSDFEPAHFLPGPVMCAVDGTDVSLPALKFAQNFAKTSQRSLLLAHVLPSGNFLGDNWIDPQDVEKARAHIESQGQSKIQSWLAQHNAAGLPLKLAHGDEFQEIRRMSVDESACTVVVGSRCLNASQRVLSSSLSSGLAAGCHVPVAVVPSSLLTPG